MSSNLTICATASNLRRSVLRRRSGRELRSHDIRLVNASAIYHLPNLSGVGESLNLREAFPFMRMAHMKAIRRIKSALTLSIFSPPEYGESSHRFRHSSLAAEFELNETIERVPG